MFLNNPLWMILSIIIISVFQAFIPLPMQQFLFACSISIKTLIIFVLPVVIFGLLLKAVAQLTSKATGIIATILVGMCCSNFISTFLSQFIGRLIYHSTIALPLPEQTDHLTPLFVFEFPKLIANNHAMIAGIIAGILLSYTSMRIQKDCIQVVDMVVQKILKGISYIIFPFIIGFIVQLNYDGLLMLLIQNYALICGIITISVGAYIFFLYVLANKWNIAHAIQALRNMFPAALTGLSSMSSAAAMPLTLVATQQNCSNKNIASTIIPITVNFHLIGDCFAIPIFAFAILKTYAITAPGWYEYLIFTMYFVLAKFSVAAVPGGGIIVMLPILEAYLHFNSSMMSLITALYILFDPIITCANILGNGGFAIIMDRLFSKKS